MDLEFLKEFAEGAILLDGLEESILGIVEEFGNGPRILYSKKKIIEILMERDFMTTTSWDCTHPLKMRYF